MSESNSNSNSGERLQKIIALAGIASRRAAEELIRDGLVTVNGKTAKLGDKADPSKDAIKVKGKLLHSALNKVYYLFYKPKNVIAMVNEDEEGRLTIKDLINKRIKDRVYPIGRMDFTGEGAMILTNDGDLTQKILKSNDLVRRYQVKVNRAPSSDELARIGRGGRIESRSMHPFHVRLVNTYAKNALIEVSFEGMGGLDIKKFFENKGFHAERVTLVSIGHLSVERMQPGTWKRLEASSVQALLKQPDLAKKQIEHIVEKQASKASDHQRKDAEEAPRPRNRERQRADAKVKIIRPSKRK